MKISQAKRFLEETIAHNIRQLELGTSHKSYIVPFFVGDPGLGKTALVEQTAAKLEIPYEQTIVAQYDAGEMGGLSFPVTVEIEDEEGNVHQEKRTTRLRPSYLPEQTVAVWNLDELAQAFLANLNICSQIVNQWRIGEHQVSPGVTICCTSNKAANKAGTTSLPMHLRDRLTYITLEVDSAEWLVYAAEHGLHPDVRSFIRNAPASLHQFMTGVDAFPSPRSWEKTATILGFDLDSATRTDALKGQLGDGMVVEFTKWLQVKDRMPDPHEVIKNPNDAPVFTNRDADILYHLLTNLTELATEKNIGAIVKYVTRLPNREFAAMWAKEAVQRWPVLDETKDMTLFKKDVLGPVYMS
jgi:hypothetical protein